MMSCPTRLPRGRSVPALVSLVDVMPTVLEVAGIDAPADHMQGKSLVPFSGPVSHNHVFSEFGRPRNMIERLHARFPGHDFSAFDRGLQCVRTPDYKLIVGSDGTEELYHLTEDPGETQNRASELSDVMADLHCALSTWRTSTNVTYRGQQVEENAAIIKSLEDLGYF